MSSVATVAEHLPLAQRRLRGVLHLAGFGAACHAGISLLIAGTYTPVGLLGLRGSLQRIVLGIVRSTAGPAAAIAFFVVRVG